MGRRIQTKGTHSEPKQLTQVNERQNKSSQDRVLQNYLSNPTPAAMNPDLALDLQRTIGNKAVIQLMKQNAGIVQRDDKDNDAPANSPQKATPMTDYMQGQLDRIRGGTVELYGLAKNHINNLAGETGGQPLIPDAKGMDRIIAKAQAKIAAGRGDVVDVGNQIKDILRGTIVYENFEELKVGYKQVAKTLSGYGLTFSKFSETFTQEGKVANANSKGTAVDTSGYGDAKLIFNLDIPPRIKRRYFAGMKKAPEFIPVELQFQTKAGLAVKSGKLGDGPDPEGEWHYRIDPIEDGGRWRFNAVQFVSDMIVRMENNGTKTAADDQLLAELPAYGLPPAHDVYDPVKKAKMDDLDVENADNFYPRLYELAFRYSQMSDTDADELSKDIGKLKRAKLR